MNPTIINIDINIDQMHIIDQRDQADLVAAALYELGAEDVVVGVVGARAEGSDPEAVQAIRDFIGGHVRLRLA